MGALAFDLAHGNLFLRYTNPRPTQTPSPPALSFPYQAWGGGVGVTLTLKGSAASTRRGSGGLAPFLAGGSMAAAVRLWARRGHRLAPGDARFIAAKPSLSGLVGRADNTAFVKSPGEVGGGGQSHATKEFVH